MNITIFEGPDGGGKSTVAAKYAEETGALLVHCGPFLRQTSKGLGRSYIEAMLPALLGYQDVVLDRCWISEPIYGRVYRDADRLGIAGRRVLERLALRCNARVVLCLPPYEVCSKNWTRRASVGEEYVAQVGAYCRVYDRYKQDNLTGLPVAHYDYTNQPLVPLAWDKPTNNIHARGEPSSGSWSARVLLVGEETSTHTDWDTFHLYPFCGLAPSGCSRWLASQLENAGISETQLLWTNAKDPGAERVVEQFCERLRLPETPGHVVALGDAAGRWLDTLDVPALVVPHPAHWRRFHTTKKYPLIALLKELLK